ncbi:MAG: heme transporter HemC [Alphaproteobacteria bacterium]|nr:heme transporter HemC [Alphaproteobacteria bacterium]
MHAFASPARFSRLARFLLPALALGAAALLAWGLYLALLASPPDYQQGETVRIMYIHVPCAWVALGLYAALGLAAGTGLIWKHALAFVFCRAGAPVGAVFTAVCLVTGCLWGQPMWGTWWVWDARLTSVLILFLLYLGVITLTRALESASGGQQRADRAGAVLLLIGLVNLPVIHFSVNWWQTLHQTSGALRLSGSSLDPAMLKPLLVIGAAHMLLAGALIIIRMQSELARRRAEALEMQDLLG